MRRRKHKPKASRRLRADSSGVVHLEGNGDYFFMCEMGAGYGSPKFVDAEAPTCLWCMAGARIIPRRLGVLPKAKRR